VSTGQSQLIAGRYRLEAPISESVTAVSYRAKHVLLDRTVALKVTRPELRTDASARAWLLREGRAANRVRDAHVIRIEDIGETESGQIYLVMEHAEGQPLSDVIRSGPMPESRALDVASQLAEALASLHAARVVARDVTRASVWLTPQDGRTDFVKLVALERAQVEGEPRLAPKGTVLGTPEYASPEQARGEDVQPNSDAYALGVLLFEMLTGRLPFIADRPEAVLELQRATRPVAPSRLQEGVSEAADALCLRLLDKNPLARWEDASTLARELELLRARVLGRVLQ
jgi:eukaryotic-like serine/threonine-protein kinase